MQANMINQVLLDNWNGDSFGINVQQLANKVGEWYVYEPYFFLRKELDVTRDTWEEAKQNGGIRHCKIYRDKFLDYVVHKEFNTFQEWLTDAGGRIEDVLYGENRLHKNQWIRDPHDHGIRRRVPYTPKYVELSALLTHLGYVPPPPLEIPAVGDTDLEEVTRMMNNLLVPYHVTTENVWVIDNGIRVRWSDYLN